MLSMEEIYKTKAYLNNLYLCKLAHMQGLDVKEILHHTSIQPDDYSNDEPSWEAFLKISQNTFEVMDYFFPEEDEPDIFYWLELARVPISKTKHLYSFVLIILDSLLLFDIPLKVESALSELGGQITIYPIDDGVVIIADTDYGTVDWALLYDTLLDKYRKNGEFKKNLEREYYEVVI